MADTEQTQDWEQACERMVQQLGIQQEREQALMAWRSGRPMTRQGMLRVLEAEDERLTDLLIDLGAAVKSWWRFDDRETSAVHGVLQQHKQANRRLVGAVFDLIDAVTKQDGDRQDRPDCSTLRAAEQMRAAIIGILDGHPVDDVCRRRLRENLDSLMDRVQFWREHPGEACDGQAVACALMPIIAQLLEYVHDGGAA